MSRPGAFADVIKRDRAPDEAVPVDVFLGEIDAFIAAHSPYTQNRVVPAIGAGRASLAVVRRYAMELYYLGLWMTPEFPLLIANAPDTDAFTMEDSEHYLHWAQNFADETGYLRDPNHVLMKVWYTRAFDVADDDLRAYVPMPETIGSVFTLLFYCRRSYEEALAALGYARERAAGMSGYAKTLYVGLDKHYGVKVKNLEVHAYAEQEHGDKALELMQRVCITASIQHRVRRAVQHTILTNEWRTYALNRWLDEPGALTGPTAKKITKPKKQR
jgi:pyrroloquinoline quinone (PQQ) biosynthesis protein C